jgi:hypothetical protein
VPTLDQGGKIGTRQIKGVDTLPGQKAKTERENR